jgi:hypothetical protein
MLGKTESSNAHLTEKAALILAEYLEDIAKSEDRIAEAEQFGSKRRRLTKERAQIHLEDANLIRSVTKAIGKLPASASTEDMDSAVLSAVGELLAVSERAPAQHAKSAEVVLRQLETAIRLLADKLAEQAAQGITGISECLDRVAAREREAFMKRHARFDAKTRESLVPQPSTEYVAKNIVELESELCGSLRRLIIQVAALLPDALQWSLAEAVSRAFYCEDVKKSKPPASTSKRASTELHQLRKALIVLTDMQETRDYSHVRMIEYEYEQTSAAARLLYKHRMQSGAKLLAYLLELVDGLGAEAEERHISVGLDAALQQRQRDWQRVLAEVAAKFAS